MKISKCCSRIICTSGSILYVPSAYNKLCQTRSVRIQYLNKITRLHNSHIYSYFIFQFILYIAYFTRLFFYRYTFSMRTIAFNVAENIFFYITEVITTNMFKLNIIYFQKHILYSTSRLLYGDK